MLDNDKVLQIVTAELSQIYGQGTDTGDGGNIPDLDTSLNYYLGNPNGREVEGRSQVTSTDVADAIEWIMPQIMKSFTQNNQIVTFDAVHQGDERQAELESEYVYEVLMKQNDGFILIHQFVKDALMQRNGILKVYYEDDIEQWTSEYTGISEQELNVLGSYQDAEIVEMSEYVDEYAKVQIDAQYEQQLMQFQQQSQQPLQPGQQPPQMPEQMPYPNLYDVKVLYTTTKGRIVIDAIPPEEFRVNPDHNSICLDNAKYTAHVVERTASELVAQGYDEEIIKDLPLDGDSYRNEYRFQAQGETLDGDHHSDDWTQDTYEIAEHYLLMDYDEDGISELCKVTTAGGDSPSAVLSVEQIDRMPWVSTTAIIMSHKWQGLSIYDRLKEIQDQKTALWRSMFDNVYFQNNQRIAVMEGMVNMDDMLVSRPNGIVRVKRLDAIQPIVTPQLSADSYTMMQYLDEVKAGRSGVSAEGGATPQNIGDRVGSQGVDRMMNAKEALVGLIIRVVAETGLKPLCIKIRDLSTQHVDSIVDFKFRGEWHKINPSSWCDRTSTTVRVGTGSGDTTEKTNALTFLMQIQEKLQAMPEQVLTDQPQIYATIDDYCKLTGLTSANKYFIDPSSQEGQQKKQQIAQQTQQEKQKQDGIQQTIAQSQLELARAETAKAQAQMANVQLKAETDMAKNQLTLQKQTMDAQIKQLEQQLDEMTLMVSSVEKSDEMKFKYDDMNARNAIEMTRIEADKESQQNENYEQNRETISE